MQHCRGRWSRRVRFRRPCVKWKKRNKNSKTNKQQQVNMTLRVCRDLTEAGSSLQRANVKTACSDGKALIKENQAEQQNEAANCQVDRNLPRCRDTISAPPDPDQQKCGDQRELMKRIKEK